MAVVTGAGTGIGRATCVRLAEEGATVVVTSRTPANVEETCAEVERAAGARPLGVPLDVADSAAVDAAFARVAEERGRIDVLVANAGIEIPPGASGTGPNLADTTRRGVGERIQRVNVDGMFYSCRAALRHMPDGGAIVTVGLDQLLRRLGERRRLHDLEGRGAPAHPLRSRSTSRRATSGPTASARA